MKSNMKNVTKTVRILVGCSKDGTIWNIWHKNMPKNKFGRNDPRGCNLKNISQKLEKMAREVGMILDK